MACEYGYALVNIQGLKTPDTEASDRGVDVHDVLAKYAEHCAKKKVPADFMFLDSLATSLGDEAKGIIETCRDSFTVDWQNFFAAEIYFGLDRDFQPTYSYDHDGEIHPIDPRWGIEGSGKEPAYCGIMDEIDLMPGGKVCRLPDTKTHPRPFDADTFQGKLYSLAAMMHLPELTEVEFGLRFVRYANITKTHKYFRSDVPQMMEDVRRTRNRQLEIHAKVDEGGALRCHGGSHCVYCPCAIDPIGIPCPNGKLNPMLKSPAEMLNWMLSTEVQLRSVKDALKQFVDGTQEPVVSTDANGKHYMYGPKEKEKVTYPLFEGSLEEGFNMPILDALLDWVRANPKDLVPRKGSKPWFNNLQIGATKLNSYLKAGKREILHNNIRNLAIVEKVVQLGITRDASVDDGQGSEYHTWDASGDELIDF